MSLVSQLNLAFTRIATEIKNRTTPATGTGTSSFLINNQAITSILGHVDVELDLGNGSASMSGTVFTLPAGFRPKFNRIIPCSAYAGGQWGTYANVLIGTGGAVQIITTTATPISALYLQASYAKGS